MDYLEETLKNCREFIGLCPDVEAGYEYFESGSGFSCTLRNGFRARLRVEHMADRSDDTLRYVILEVYPGIIVESSYICMVSEYCQRAENGPDRIYMGVNSDMGYVYAHCEVCFRDNPVTVQILSRMLSSTTALLDIHAPALRHLARGQLPPLWPERIQVRDGKPLTEAEQRYLEGSTNSIRAFACDKHPATAGFGIGKTPEDRFFLEIATERRRYQAYLRISGGWLILSACSDIRADPACRAQMARYINDINDRKIVGHLALAENGCIYATIATYLPGGPIPISERTLTEMEDLTLLLLRSSERQLLCLACGAAPSEPEESGCADLFQNTNTGGLFREFLRSLPEDEGGKPASSILPGAFEFTDPGEGSNTSEPAQPIQTRKIGFARESSHQREKST